MRPSDWLYAPGGRIRAAWRLILFVLAYVACGLAFGTVVSPLIQSVARVLGVSLIAHYWLSYVEWISLGGAALTHWVLLGWLERRPWRDVGLGRDALRPRALAGSWALGALAIGVPSLLLIAAQQVRIVPSPDGSSLGTAAALLAKLAPAAMYEELVFRGYPFMVLRESAGPAVALTVTSVLFGLVHMFNPGVAPLPIVVVVLAGFFLGAVLLVTGSLWAAFAAHLAWNWTLSGVVHAAVSGLGFTMPDYRAVDAGPDWITGGAWGPEGGAVAGLGLLSALALLRWRGASHFLQRGRTAAGVSDG